MASKIVGFNYDKVEAKYREATKEHARQINDLLERTARNIVEIGKRLIEVKEALPFGLFHGWLIAEFRWSQTRAVQFMQVTRKFGDMDCLDKFQPTVIIQLAKGTTHPKAIEEAVSRARAGEPISGVVANDLIRRHRPVQPKPAINANVRDRIKSYLHRTITDTTPDEQIMLADFLIRFAERLKQKAKPAGSNGNPPHPVEGKHTLTLGTDAQGEVTLDLLKLLESRALIQGNSGAGKSWLLRLLAEKAAERVPTLIIDTEGDFSSLKDAVDVVLVGPEGELPVDPETANDLAGKLADLRVSAVVDISELETQPRRDFVAGFCRALVDLPKELWKPRLVMIDEAHLYAPQGSESGCSESRKAIIDLMTLGRKRGLCGVLATQRLSKLHKDAAAECTNVFIGRTWLPRDQQRAGEMLGLGASERQQLRDLKPGQFYAVGPALLRSGVVLLGSGAVKSAHGKPKEVPAPPQSSEVLQAQSPSVPAGSLLQFPAGGAA